MLSAFACAIAAASPWAFVGAGAGAAPGAVPCPPHAASNSVAATRVATQEVERVSERIVDEDGRGADERAVDDICLRTARLRRCDATGRAVARRSYNYEGRYVLESTPEAVQSVSYTHLR